MKMIMKKEEFINKFNNATLFDKVTLMSNLTAVPVSVSNGTWSGLEIRIVPADDFHESGSHGPLAWTVRADDADFAWRLIQAFRDIDDHIIEISKKVWLEPHLGLSFGFLHRDDPDKNFRRWRVFKDFIKKSYDTDKTCWWWESESGLPENTECWAFRAIVGGVKPSAIGLKLFKEHKVKISEAGIMTLKKGEGWTIWHFPPSKRWEDLDHEHGEKLPVSPIDSFGVGGAFGAYLNKDETGLIRNNKVPEKWEIEANVYVGFEKPNKIDQLKKKIG